MVNRCFGVKPPSTLTFFALVTPLNPSDSAVPQRVEHAVTCRQP